MNEDRNTMLIIDDIEVNRAILVELFSDTYNILEAENGEEGLKLARANADKLTIILLDLYMPKMDGYSFLRIRAQENGIKNIPVIVITSDDNSSTETAILDMGAADITSKPIIADVVRRRVANVVNATMYKNYLENVSDDLYNKLRRGNQAVIDTLVGIIEHRSLESGQHILKIKQFTKTLLQEVAALGKYSGLDEDLIELITSTSALHDIGKIVIADSILNKPGRLTFEEFNTMKSHTTEGGKIIKKIDSVYTEEFVNFAYSIAMYHHERYDGRGYPEGLKGDSIPLCAQVVGVADVYDALTSERVYKAAYSHDEAVRMILAGECGVFSEEMMTCFKSVADKFKVMSEELAGTILVSPNNIYVDTKAQNSGGKYKLDHYKYLTAAKLLNCTVLEVDFGRNDYKIINSASHIFPTLNLPTKGLLEELFAMIKPMFAEEDYNKLIMRADQYRMNIIAGKNVEGMSNYKIFSVASKEYVRVSIQLSCVDTQNVESSKALALLRVL